MARRKVLPDTAPSTLFQQFKERGAAGVVGTICYVIISESAMDADGPCGMQVRILDVEYTPSDRCGGPVFIVEPTAGFGRFEIDPNNLRMTVAEFIEEHQREMQTSKRQAIIDRLKRTTSVYQNRLLLGRFIKEHVPDGFKNVELVAELEDMGSSEDQFDRLVSSKVNRLEDLAIRLAFPKAVDEDDRGCC